jgi:hypothetical protein
LPNLMMRTEFYDFSHLFPFIYLSIALNEYNVHRERLSEKTLNKGCDSLTSERKSERVSRRACPA